MMILTSLMKHSSNHLQFPIIYQLTTLPLYVILFPRIIAPEVYRMERLVKTGYVKMIAIDVHDLESKIVDERNTNFLCDIENFQNKYSNISTVKCVYIHMDDNYDITFLDYKKVHPHIHPFDYMRDIVKKHDGKLIKGSDYLRITHEDDYVELIEIDLRD